MLEIMKEYQCDICIIGAGPAGLNAALYCSRANRDIIVLEGKVQSALEKTKKIENWLGEKSIKGETLLNKFRNHVNKLENVRIIKGDVISLMLGMGKNMISTRAANITADVIVIATGTGERKEVIKGESNLLGYGISYCALCDGPAYKEKIVYLYGEDDELIEDALILHQMGCIVNIITPKDITELPVNIEKIKKKSINILDKMNIIELIPNSEGLLEKMKCKSVSSEQEEEIELDALFIFSHVPSTSIFKKAGVELDDKDNISVNQNQETNIKGVYAAGDVTGGLFQAIFAAAEGAKAGINAAKYCRQLEKK
ncbi:MAG: FAD-dependent oxidoreductase [Candidatus Lokiarchaeota archaeon]|nr:FAD-dependent oxidoreductase [Candidatus Lokiarchaeota archaeon]